MQKIHLRSMRRFFALAVIISQSLLFSGSFQYALAETSPPNINHLIISAVQITGGTNHTQEDFVEFYNPTNSSIDLKGFRLVKRTAAGTTDTSIVSWTASTIVPAHHFWLWANSTFTGISTVPDSLTTATLADNNGVALRQGAADTGVIIDSVAWGNTSNGFVSSGLENPGANQSLVRQDLFAEQGVYEIKQSAVRNSSDEFLPTLPVIPDPVANGPTTDQTTDPLPPITVTPPTDPVVTDTPPETTPDPTTEPTTPPITPEPIPNLQITELLPNPVGTDAGAEQIELYNAGDTTVNLDKLILDDIAPTDPVSSNAEVLPSIEIAPDSFAVITIPSTDFALNNTGGDIVTLLTSDGQVIDSVSYQGTAPEGQSYSKFKDDNWMWATSTIGEDNGLPPITEANNAADTNPLVVLPVVKTPTYDDSGVKISEIYPAPSSGEKEFLELYNSGEEIAQLSMLTLWVGDKHKQLPDQVLKPGEYFVIDSGFPAGLRNSGQTVALKLGSKNIDSVTYPQAIKASSYALFEDGFLWTTEVTKGNSNILKLPEEIKIIKPITTPKPPTSKPAVKVAAKTSVKPATKTVTKIATSKAATTPSNSNTNNSTTASSKSDSKKESAGKIIAMGAAAVTAGLAALYKLIFTGRVS